MKRERKLSIGQLTIDRQSKNNMDSFLIEQTDTGELWIRRSAEAVPILKITSQGVDITELVVDNTTIEDSVDIPNMGGLTIAETYIHSTITGYGVGTKHSITTTYQNFNNHQITFTAPANGKVKVKFPALFVGIDSSVGSETAGEEISVRIYDSDNSSYITDISGVVWDGNKFMQTDESGNHMQVIEANVGNLTPGASYTYQFSFKKGEDDTDTQIFFGADYPPVIIRVETLGNVISHTS